MSLLDTTSARYCIITRKTEDMETHHGNSYDYARVDNERTVCDLSKCRQFRRCSCVSCSTNSLADRYLTLYRYSAIVVVFLGQNN
jgi:hypothetical protein